MWLLKRGHYEEAKSVLLEAARVNNRLDSIPKDFDNLLTKQMHRIMSEPPQAKWTQIWEDWRTSLNLACVHLSQTLSIILYYAILLNFAVFGRQYLYTTTIVAGLAELMGAFIGYIFVMYTKSTKWQWTGVLNIAGGILFFTPWFYTFNGKWFINFIRIKTLIFVFEQNLTPWRHVFSLQRRFWLRLPYPAH